MQIPLIESYSSAQLEEARKWPAIQRYLSIIERSPTSFSERLRWQRHHAWLRAALATCHEAATAKDVCEFWSQEAEKLILEANQEAGTEQFCILALGKLGACELNLSSDVDLIFARPDDSDFEQKRMRDFQSLLSEHTSFGFALRVDLNLRPGGRSSALVPTQSEFEYHYGYQGEMWERLAFVRMRILSGPEKLTDDINTFSRKF